MRTCVKPVAMAVKDNLDLESCGEDGDRLGGMVTQPRLWSTVRRSRVWRSRVRRSIRVCSTMRSVGRTWGYNMGGA